MYTIVFSNDAKKDLKELHKKAPQALPKLAKLLDELREHPRIGTGQVEPLTTPHERHAQSLLTGLFLALSGAWDRSCSQEGGGGEVAGDIKVLAKQPL